MAFQVEGAQARKGSSDDAADGQGWQIGQHGGQLGNQDRYSNLPQVMEQGAKDTDKDHIPVPEDPKKQGHSQET